MKTLRVLPLFALLLLACQGEPEGLAKAQPAAVRVRLDFEARPLPEIPLPNDLATRHFADAATGRLLNASMVAPTSFERGVRERVDQMDGWGVYSPITIPFDGDIDPSSITSRHHGDDYAFANDAIYLVDVTKGSPTYGKPAELDIGNGNFPLALEQLGGYWKSDPRGETSTLLLEEVDEDSNANGKLDPGEDTDLDGVLDKPNYKPGVTKSYKDMTLAERADATLTFWERETRTLIVRALVPLRERTTYAVVVTRRLVDNAKRPVGSPYAAVNHLAQTRALEPLRDILAAAPATFGSLAVDDIAFAWTFTTGTVETALRTVRQGLHGAGPQQHLAAAFPPDVTPLPLFDAKPTTTYENIYALSGETFASVAQLIANGGLVSFGGPEQKKRFTEALQYVGYHQFGTYKSPQLFDRKDKDGKYLGYHDMVWPARVDGAPITARSEDVTYWMTVPRKEATKTGKPHGIVILGHGYTGSKTEVFGFHQYFARMGLAVIAIDNVSHGFTVGKKDAELLNSVFGAFGIGKMAKALMSNRSWDQDLDGMEDSGADFWTAYTFHTRDVVRQTAVDYVQLVRVLRGFDGKRQWAADVNGNGKADDLAGDIDGDGTVDVGGPTMPITMLGGSLGGIMSAVVGGLEPEIAAVVPVAGGGGLIDVGVRSIQGGVREAVQLRLMGPLYVGVADAVAGSMSVRTIVPNLNDTAEIEVAKVGADKWSALGPGDVVRGDNLDNGEYDCSRVVADSGCVKACDANAAITDKASCPKRCLTFRLGLASDIATPAQRHVLTFYQGEAFEVGVVDPAKHRACKVRADAKRLLEVSSFSAAIQFAHRSAPLTFKPGDPLAPLAEGLGLHRARPELRRFMGFAQMVLDPADPAVWGRHLLDDDLKTHAIVLNTVGDMNVPVSTGAAIGRAAGLLDWTKKVAEWGGRTVNQVLIDTYVLEAVDKIPRFVDSKGNGVLFDPEDLSQSATPVAAGTSSLPAAGTKVSFAAPAPRGNDGFEVPRLSPPLHSRAIGADRHGGVSGTFFPFVEPGGKHGFWEPGAHVDFLKKQCQADAKASGGDAKACDVKDYFDHGAMIMHAVGLYLASGGTVWKLEPCMSKGDCGDILPPPPPR